MRQNRIDLNFIGSNSTFEWLAEQLRPAIQKGTFALHDNSASNAGSVVLLCTTTANANTIIAQSTVPVVLIAPTLRDVDEALLAQCDNCIVRSQTTPYWLERVLLRSAETTATADLVEQLSQRAEDLQMIANFAAELRTISNVSTLSHCILRHFDGFFNFEGSIMYVLNDSANKFVSIATLPNEPAIEERYARPGSLTQMVVERGEMHILYDWQTSPNLFRENSVEFANDENVSLISLPLKTPEDLVNGILHFAMPERVTISKERRQLVTTLSEIAGAALKRVMLMEDLEQQVANRSLAIVEKNQELEALNEQLTELDRLKSKFVSDVSHELRTPVTALKLHLDLMKYGRPEKQAQYLRIVDNEVDRLKQLVLDVLKLSRFDLGRVKTEFERLQLNDLIPQEMALYEAQAQQKGVQLTFIAGDDLPLIVGEPTQLGELLSYLLNNAVLYTSEGQITVETAFDCREDDPIGKAKNHIVLTVQDTGAGICEADLPQIFERFYRGENSHATKGSGLGLDVARQIVKLHHGCIHVESEEGVGSKFFVYLPVEVEALVEQPAMQLAAVQ